LKDTREDNVGPISVPLHEENIDTTTTALESMFTHIRNVDVLVFFKVIVLLKIPNAAFIVFFVLRERNSVQSPLPPPTGPK